MDGSFKIFIGAIGSFTAIIIYFLKLREDRIKTRREKAALLLNEIDSIIEGRKRDIRDQLKNRPKELGTANYTAFMMTLSSGKRSEIETQYQSCKENTNKSPHDWLLEL